MYTSTHIYIYRCTYAVLHCSLSLSLASLSLCAIYVRVLLRVIKRNIIWASHTHIHTHARTHTMDMYITNYHYTYTHTHTNTHTQREEDTRENMHTNTHTYNVL